MADAVTGKRLEEILAEQGLSTGFVYGAPQDESWDGVVDREIKLEPKARTNVADGQPVLPEFFHGVTPNSPIGHTRKFEECRSAMCWKCAVQRTLACAYAMGFGEAADWGAIGGTVLCNLIFFLRL